MTEISSPGPRLPVWIELDPPQELNHSSYAVAGLFGLRAQGLIHDVRLRRTVDPHRGELHIASDGAVRRSPARARKTTFFTVRTGDGRRFRAAIDFRDSPRIFAADAVEKCDVLFKRNYQTAVASRLSGVASASIARAGLSYAVRPPPNSHEWIRDLAFWCQQIRDATRIRDRRLPTRLAQAIREGWSQQLAGSQHPVQALSSGPPDLGDGSVFFQTRTFNRTDDADAVEITEQRAALIRALRARFGGRFVGGFVPDALSKRQYPDCLSTLSPKKENYFNAMRNASVVVSTRGLVDSPPWKLGEYLSTGRCIVSETVRAELDPRLRPGHEVAFFDDLETCVGLCEDLLADPARRLAVAAEANAYFASHVHPVAGMYRLTRELLARTSGQPDVAAGQ